MQNEAENIKNSLLEKLKFFNNGFANVYLDETASRYLSLDGKTDIALGIDDRYGNYFYIRNNGTVKISKAKVQMSNCVTSLDLNTNMVLVANMSNANPDKLLECLLNALSVSVSEDFEITSATLTNEKVVLSEYSFIGIEKIKSLLMRLGKRTLVKIEFVLYKQMNPNSKDCYTCNPCIDCNEVL